LSGSTYAVRREEATLWMVVLAIALGGVVLVGRWLDILPLGATIAVGRRVNLSVVSAALLAFSAVLTVAANRWVRSGAVAAEGVWLFRHPSFRNTPKSKPT